MDYSLLHFEKIMDYSPWFSLNFLKKSWTIVHGFHQICIMYYSPWFSSHFFEKIMDYSPWFSLYFFEKIMDYSPW